MAEDQSKKEEEKFEVNAEGENLGHISLEQARVLAMERAREAPGAYGSSNKDVLMAFEVVVTEQTEDHYIVTLSFRPLGEFKGLRGQEQFFIEKEGNVAHRQVLVLPRRQFRFPVVRVAISLVVVTVVAAVLVVTETGGGGDREEPPSVAISPTHTPVPPTIGSTQASTAPVAAPATGEQPADTPDPTLLNTPTPTLTSRQTPTPTPLVYDDFRTKTEFWHYVGSANIDRKNEYLTLTSPNSDQTGVIWLKQNVNEPFVAEFSYNVGGGTGGDGLVFMFYKDRNYLPGKGGCLGFTPRSGQGFLQLSSRCTSNQGGYGIEFDGSRSISSEFDEYPGDTSENHVALIRASAGNHIELVDEPKTEDGAWHNVRVEVGMKAVTVVLDGQRILSWQGPIERTFSGLGFSASTGGRTNWHIIDNVSIDLQDK